MLNWPLVSHVIISPLRIPYLRLNIVLIITLTVAMLGLMYGWSDVTICKKERFFRPIYKSESKFLSERINAAKAKVSPQDMPAKMVWSFFDFWGKALAKWGYHAWQYHRTLLENPPTEIHKREPRDWPNPREGFEDSFLIEDASVSNLWPFGVDSNFILRSYVWLTDIFTDENHIRYFNIQRFARPAWRLNMIMALPYINQSDNAFYCPYCLLLHATSLWDQI